MTLDPVTFRKSGHKNWKFIVRQWKELELVLHTLHRDTQIHTVSQAQAPIGSPPPSSKRPWGKNQRFHLKWPGCRVCVACLPRDKDTWSKIGYPDLKFCVLAIKKPIISLKRSFPSPPPPAATTKCYLCMSLFSSSSCAKLQVKHKSNENLLTKSLFKGGTIFNCFCYYCYWSGCNRDTDQMHFEGGAYGQNCWFVQFRERGNKEIRT